jgi:prepilin peptidase CpaA
MMVLMTEVTLNAFLGGILIIAALTDIRSQRIPNTLTYSSVVFALAFHIQASGLHGLLFSLSGLALGLAFLILPYLMGGMGAGDVKLLGAVGAALGPKGVFAAALFTALVGGVYAAILILIKYKDCRGLIARYATTLKIFAASGQLYTLPAAENENPPKLCYGVAIALGTLIAVYLQSTGNSVMGLLP